MTPDQQTRRDLAACHRLVDQNGWTELIHTHLSARLPSDSTRVLLTPYGRDFGSVRASELVTVDATTGTIVDDPVGAGVHPAARGVHLPLYLASSMRMAIIHTHTVAGIAVSAQKEGLRPLSQHALRFHDRLARHAYHGVVLDQAVGIGLAHDLGQHEAALLHNHGLLTCGRSVADAFERMYYLEKACQIQVAVGRGPCHTVDAELAEATARQFERPTRDAAAMTWTLLLAQLDAKSPDYAE